MRLAVIIGSVISVGSLLVLAACGDSESSDISGDEDAGKDSGRRSSSSSSSSSSGSSGDPDPDSGTSSSGGSSSGGAKPRGTQLATGPVILWGVTSDGYAVYQPLPATAGAATSLEAVSITAGTKTTLVPTLADDDVVTVSGGAVAWWTAVANGKGTFNVWTKANGAKTAVSTDAVPEIFSASKDGSRIAFSVAATLDGTMSPTSTNFAVTGSAAPTATGSLPANANLVATNCSPDFGFAGNVFFSGHCIGVTAGATAARLYTVSAAGVVTRLDASGAAAGALKAHANGAIWFADDTGSKVFVIATASSTGRIITVATGQPGQPLDGNTQEGFMLPDGSAAVFRTTTTIGRRTGAAATTQLLANGTTPNALFGLTPDGARLLFSTTASGQTTDIKSIDTTTATQAATDLAPTAVYAGLTGNGARAIYLTDLAATGGTLKSKAVAGGTETSLATSITTRPLIAESGTGIALRVNPQTSGQITMYDLQALDGATGGTPTPIAGTVPQGLYEINGSKLVYVTFDKTNPGLYVTDLP